MEKRADREATAHDPLSLSGIEQAAYVLQCFEKEMTTDELVKCLNGETSLAQACLIFFGQMKWIEEGIPGRWRVSKKGRDTADVLKSPEKIYQGGSGRKFQPAAPDSII